MAKKKAVPVAAAPPARPKKTAKDFKAEIVPAASLKPHPQNYRVHPDDELEHIAQSIRDHGFYRNIVVAKDDFIIAGHGVLQAATEKLHLEHVPIVRLAVKHDTALALKVLIGDNEIGHLVEIDDRKLADTLKGIKSLDATGLLGTGYNEEMLANLMFITRPASEVASLDEARHWAGLPGYEARALRMACTVNFETEKDREAFFDRIGQKPAKIVWYPPKVKDDVRNVRYEQEGKDKPAPKKATKKKAKR